MLVPEKRSSGRQKTRWKDAWYRDTEGMGLNVEDEMDWRKSKQSQTIPMIPDGRKSPRGEKL